MSLVVQQRSNQPTLFNWETLNSDQADRLYEIERKVQTASTTAICAYLDIGEQLQKARQVLLTHTNGGFEGWVRQTFGWTLKKAEWYIDKVEKYGDLFRELISQNLAQVNIPMRVLDLLDDASPQVLDEAVNLLKSGAKLTGPKVQALIDKHNEPLPDIELLEYLYGIIGTVRRPLKNSELLDVNSHTLNFHQQFSSRAQAWQYWKANGQFFLIRLDLLSPEEPFDPYDPLGDGDLRYIKEEDFCNTPKPKPSQTYKPKGQLHKLELQDNHIVKPLDRVWYDVGDRQVPVRIITLYNDDTAQVEFGISKQRLCVNTNHLFGPAESIVEPAVTVCHKANHYYFGIGEQAPAHILDLAQQLYEACRACA